MERLKNVRVLVTGGSGFIGGYVVKKLLSKGYKVSVIDINIHSSSVFFLEKLKSQVKFTNLDIRDRPKVFRFFSKYKFDYVIHLAAEPIVERGYDDPLKTFETNIMGTANVLEGLRRSSPKTGVIVASSDKAYGKTQDKTYTEKSPLVGDHPYDVSKSCTDLIAQTYAKTYGMPIVVTRFGNVYGGGDVHLDRIIPGICMAIIDKKKLNVRSDGTYVRDYIYVEDVADGYIFLLKNIDKAAGQVYNFSSDDNFSVVDLIHKASEYLGEKISYNILNSAKNEIPYQHLDYSKIRTLGWKPKHTLKVGLEKTLSWYKKFYKAGLN
ncbi:SDR family NAD(P)-dependent oxidoreductase [Candidatus Gottesmanbacteria bacterium]|nr:SDR family NAD(P)-dependent oxidoreductase [Candidatus Gottesmanbacteria bacterium]